MAQLLVFAARRNKEDVVRYLLYDEVIHDVQARDNNGCAAIHYAAKFNYVEILKMILDNGISPAFPSRSGIKAIHFAAMEGNLESFKILLEEHIYAHKQEDWGMWVTDDWDMWTPMHFAALRGQIAIMNYIIENVPRLKDVCEEGDHLTFGVVQAAIASEQLHVVEMIVSWLGKKCLNALETMEERATLLAFASFIGTSSIIQYLLHNGIDVNAKDERGYTPLHQAALAGNWHVITTLLDAGANINEQNENGDTPLHMALLDRNEKTAIALMEHDTINIGLRNNFEELPIDIAREEGLYRLVHLLSLEYQPPNAA